MHIALCVALALSLAQGDDVPIPQVFDPRLKIELFAADPQIVTPTGLAVDAAGRVLVVESHTHFRPENYQGPPADRIRMFVDSDADGRADRITTFFEGTSSTMNVAVHPDGSVYVATRMEIFRLRDVDGDGRAEERTPIAHLETKGDYPHNGLSGFAFDFAGNVYFGLGENLGADFKLIGTDGSIVSDLEGGQIYRCKADGGRIELVAFGFWNPFHLAFDAFERLFAVDNDPDSLPPCRLMHIVRGGNYGYRYRNGRKGVHPFTAWNGELPGTLPMVAGTGEAPSGVLAYESDQLPADYVGDLLGTSWGDHRIERFHLEPRGASFQAVAQKIIGGDDNFRPVGIALAPDGSLFVSDWVLKEYHVHGKGRLWHITAVKPPQSPRPRAATEAIHSAHRPLREQAARELAAAPAGRQQLAKLAQGDPSSRVRAVAIVALASVADMQAVHEAALKDPSVDVRTLAIRCCGSAQPPAELLASDSPPEVRAEAMRATTVPERAEILWRSVGIKDAFLAQAAREGLARSGVGGKELSGASPEQRLAQALILRETRAPRGIELLPRLLRDPSGDVRFAAIQWIAEERLQQFRSSIGDALTAGPATARLFGGYLSALERLEGVKRISSDEWAGEQYIARALDDPATSPEVRRWSLRMLRADHPLLSLARLQKYIDGDDKQLALEAVRTLRESRRAERMAVLTAIAADAKYPTHLRAEAIVGLEDNDPAARDALFQMALGADRVLRDEALRGLRDCRPSPEEKASLSRLADQPDAAELVARVVGTSSRAGRPAADNLSGWLQLLDNDRSAADAAAGQRIFFHPKLAGCARCHQMSGRGARVGPELTTTTAAVSRRRLIESIVSPSQEIAPHYSSWLIITTKGTTLVGMLVSEEATGKQTYANTKGELFALEPPEIETRRPQAASIMPQGLTETLTVQELRDLLAFLQFAGKENGN